MTGCGSSSGHDTSTRTRLPPLVDRQQVVDRVQLLARAVGVVHPGHRCRSRSAGPGRRAGRATVGRCSRLTLIVISPRSMTTAATASPKDAAPPTSARSRWSRRPRRSSREPAGRAGDEDGPTKQAVAGGVAALRRTEHALAVADHLGRGLGRPHGGVDPRDSISPGVRPLSRVFSGFLTTSLLVVSSPCQQPLHLVRRRRPQRRLGSPGGLLPVDAEGHALDLLVPR